MVDKADLSLQLRVVPIIGPGKMQLLEAIERFGSISGAARSMGMAYPNAWKLIDDLNHHFREPLVERITGGKRGGGASLTDNGRAVLSIFRSMQAKARILFASDLEALSYLLAPGRTRRRLPSVDRVLDSSACLKDEDDALTDRRSGSGLIEEARAQIAPPISVITVTSTSSTMISAAASRYSNRWNAVMISSPRPPAPTTPSVVAARRLCSQR